MDADRVERFTHREKAPVLIFIAAAAATTSTATTALFMQRADFLVGDFYTVIGGCITWKCDVGENVGRDKKPCQADPQLWMIVHILTFELGC